MPLRATNQDLSEGSDLHGLALVQLVYVQRSLVVKVEGVGHTVDRCANRKTEVFMHGSYPPSKRSQDCGGADPWQGGWGKKMAPRKANDTPDNEPGQEPGRNTWIEPGR